ncbi:MAG: hypothetical protein DRN14_01015 [Thermoplasmata archaeon]|nr:MAG: hypothetical protein DRN14_01015 [Thermoplasmata archaeon]
MKIISLGSWASYGLKGKKHFSLILEHRGKKVWIDPAVKYTEPVDFILLSSPDNDHWKYLPNYLEKFPDTPIYSTRAVISHMRLLLPKANWKKTERPLKLGGKSIKLIAIPEMVGKPAVAFKVGTGKDAVVIVPEFIRLGKREKELMKGTTWIIGVGEYDKPKSNDHKATFKDLVELAKELNPKKIYITNYRTSLLKHKEKILEELKPWNGEFLSDGDELEIKVKMIEKMDGLYLVKPHAKLIYDGLKSMIVKSRKFKIANKPYIICDADYAYGEVLLEEPIEIKTKKEFLLLCREHLITPDEFKSWNWSFPLYGYRIKEFKAVEKPRKVNLPQGIQTFVKDIEQYYVTEKLHLDQFRSEGVDYDLKHPRERWRELIADLRYLGNSAYPRLKSGKKWGDWTLKDVLQYFARIVDTLRSIYFPIIPPTNEKLYKEYYGKDPKKAKKSSYWKCYEEAKKYMKSKPPKDINEAKEWDKKRSGLIKKATIKPGYYSKAKPYYRGYFQELEDELKSIKWTEQKLLIDTKWDGLRMTVGKANGKGFAFVDPEGLKKKSPNITKRIPGIIEEIEKNLPDNTVLDCEFLAMHPKKHEMLHRTVANAILNSKMSGKELEDYAVIFAFDILFYEGQDLRDMPLHERLEYLSRIKSTDHIWVEDVSKKFPDKADAFIINGSDIDKIKKIADFIRDAKNGRPKYCAEGIMIKRLDWPYEYPQNHGWMKVKFYHELDLRVISKKLVKGTKDVYNYILGYDTPKSYAEAYLNVGTKDWYGKVFVYKNGKIVAEGKDAKDYLNDKDAIFITKMGKSDNAKELSPVKVGDILRIAAEEVLKFDNPKFPEYPRYSFYIGRVLEPIPEKNVTDSLETIDKLSQLEPERIPIDELRHIREVPETSKAKKITKDQVCEWVEEKRIPEEIYKEIREELKPLPKILYVDYDEGIAWAQMHIRGLDPDDTKKYLDGKLSFAKLIEGHSIHVDLRMKFKNAFVQWVITQDAIPDYFDTIIGRRDPKTGNASKGLAIVKPSAEEPSEEVKAKDKELIIGPEDAKLIEKYVLFDKSYIIEAGDVGATPYKDAYMCAIWIGKVKAGVQREDLHEYFLYPSDDMPERNKELFNGRFIIRCFKAGNAKRWWVWKAYDDPYPMDPILHADTGHYWPIKAEKLEKFGREAYREESMKKYKKKLGC